MKSFKETLGPVNEEMSWKVEVEGLPPMYMNGRSAGAVKNELRKVLKNPGDAINSITRVTPTEIKKDFRLRLTDKNDLEGKPVEDDEMNEAVDPNETGGKAETEMAMNQIKQMRHYLDGIERMVKGDGDMEEWVQNKITKATDYLKSVYGYNTGKVDEGYSPDTDPDYQKKKRMSTSDKNKLGAIAQMMAREKEKRQKQLALKAREKGDFESARKHDQAAAKARR